MALIPPAYLNSVVALGGPSQDGSIQYNATGFLYGYPTGETDVNGRELYWIFLVTNRHVFAGATERGTTLHARFNRPMGAEPHVYTLQLQETAGLKSWVVHPQSDIDVAVLQLNPAKLMADGLEYFFFEDDRHTFTRQQSIDVGMSEGDGVFVLGFPLGQAGDERNYAIVRQGIVARVQDWLKGDARTFMVDASIFPGNSGGPVLLKPEFTKIEGTNSSSRCGLIGMVSSYLPYQEIAVSTQTKRPRMIFEENSGLGIVVPYDDIMETVKTAIAKPASGQPITPVLTARSG